MELQACHSCADATHPCLVMRPCHESSIRLSHLVMSGSVLQINKDHLTILNDTRIQDGHHEVWEQEYVAGLVAAEVDVRDINTVRHYPAMASKPPGLSRAS